MRMVVWTLALLGASPAWSQELRSIDDTMQGIDDFLHVSAYTAMRCAGLFDGIVAYGGQNMPAELVEQYQAHDRGLPAKDFEVEFKNSDAEAVRFRDIYSSRLQNNYDLTGQMLESDPLAKADLALCGQVVPRIESIVAKEMGQATE